MTWKLLRRAIIKHVSGPLNARGNDVAMEQLTLAYERLEMGVSAEPFTAHAFAVELRLPGRDEPLCHAAFCEVRRARTATLDHDAARRRRRRDVRLHPGPESFGHVTLRRG